MHRVIVPPDALRQIHDPAAGIKEDGMSAAQLYEYAGGGAAIFKKPLSAHRYAAACAKDGDLDLVTQLCVYIVHVFLRI